MLLLCLLVLEIVQTSSGVVALRRVTRLQVGWQPTVLWQSCQRRVVTYGTWYPTVLL